MTKLPQKFLDDMKEILKYEYDDFIKNYKENENIINEFIESYPNAN